MMKHYDVCVYIHMYSISYDGFHCKKNTNICMYIYIYVCKFHTCPNHMDPNGLLFCARPTGVSHDCGEGGSTGKKYHIPYLNQGISSGI